MKLFIIGGGAAGFFAAIQAKTAYPDMAVTIIEKSSDVLSKVKISGGGRCNVTHACFEPKELVQNYPRGHKELIGPFFTFQPKDTIDWFKSHGVMLKTEKDNRMFPTTDSSQTIVDCLLQTATHLGVKLWLNTAVNQITHDASGFIIHLENGTSHSADRVILATGSARGGHELAKKLGHTIVSPIPSLFTFKVPDKALHELSGLSVKAAEAWVSNQKKQSQKGPILITHWGFSGPAIIKLSAWQAKPLFDSGYTSPLTINWLADISHALFQKTIRQIQTNSPKKQIHTFSPFPELPQRLWRYFLIKAGISAETTWQQLSEKKEDALFQTCTQDTYTINGKGTFKEEFVTCGGVSLKEIDFKTMQSKLCPGLFVVGELLDIDGVTGGFNFQNAWTTGFIAGSECGE